jgi:hypothetical protein
MRFENAFEGIGAGPVVAGAAALGILLGLTGGTSIDTTPLQRGKTFEQLIPDRQIAAADSWDETDPYLPDHYAQVTRNGRIEVPELRSYILRHERPAYFVDQDYLYPPYGETAEAAPQPETSAIDEPAPLPEMHLTGKTVPGQLEQTPVPIGNDAVEPVQVGYSPPIASAAL